MLDAYINSVIESLKTWVLNMFLKRHIYAGLYKKQIKSLVLKASLFFEFST